MKLLVKLDVTPSQLDAMKTACAKLGETTNEFVRQAVARRVAEQTGERTWPIRTGTLR